MAPNTRLYRARKTPQITVKAISPIVEVGPSIVAVVARGVCLTQVVLGGLNGLEVLLNVRHLGGDGGDDVGHGEMLLRRSSRRSLANT